MPLTKATARSNGADAHHSQAGFSLIELIVGICIIGILTGIGILFMPLDRMQAREAARIVASDLNRSRTEAIKHNTNVAFDFDNTNCSGYCVYTDYSRSAVPDGNLDGDANGTIELAEPILIDRTITEEFPRMIIASADFGSTPRVWFDVRGLPRASNGAYFATTGRIVLRPRDNSSGFVVTLEPQGRVQVTSE